jgi:hypothetical protein
VGKVLKLPFGWAWLKASWRWFVPALLAFMVGFWLLIHQVIERSDAFVTATSYARSSDAIQAQLGNIRSARLPWFGSASIQSGGDVGQAKFSLELVGDKGAGRLYVELVKRGVWELRFARLIVGSSSEILVDAAAVQRCDVNSTLALCGQSLP